MLPGSVDVATVALYLGVTTRRVRALCMHRRLSAWKNPTGAWEIRWPVVVNLGTRGPRLGQKPKRGMVSSSGKGGLERVSSGSDESCQPENSETTT